MHNVDTAPYEQGALAIVLSRGTFAEQVNPTGPQSCDPIWTRESGVISCRAGNIESPPVQKALPPPVIRFGVFQLDQQAGQLLKNGRVVRLKPQPFKLLQLLVTRAGEVVSREEIRDTLWGADTYVDFEQGVNSAIKQVREALNEDADRPLYIETVPKRGYRFTAPIEAPKPAATPIKATDLNLQKALWLNIAELKLAEERRRARRKRLLQGGVIVVAVLAAAVLLIVLL
jgi:DNA-binding winged helix-turn-helix (wHTH) protein